MQRTIGVHPTGSTRPAPARRPRRAIAASAWYAPRWRALLARAA